MTDLHRDDLKHLVRLQERQTEAAERQADALEDLAEQLAIQNGALQTQIRTLEKLVAVEFSGHPDDVPTPNSIASSTEDGVLSIAEQVDVDEARRWTDD